MPKTFFILLFCFSIQLVAQTVEDSPEALQAEIEAQSTQEIPMGPEEEAELMNVILPLPEWNPEDRQGILVGRVIPGDELLGRGEFDYAELEIPEVEPIPIEDQPQRYNPKELQLEILPKYLIRASNQYIIDPQMLVGQQMRGGLEHFLSMQAKDSPVRIYFVLFNREQLVPAGVNLPLLVRHLFGGEKRAVVIQYHLGAPKRSQLVTTKDLEAIFDEEKRRQVLQKAVEAALQQSDAEGQLQSFGVALSNEMLWFEPAIRKLIREESESVASSNEQANLAAQSEEGSASGVDPNDRMTLSKLGDLLVKIGIQSLIIACVALVVIGAWIWWLKKKVYHFPKLEVSQRLGASHGAAVGPVLQFKNPNLGPSRYSRDEVPDYLRKI